MAWTGTTRREDSESLLARLRVFHMLSRDQVERLPFFMVGEELQMSGNSSEEIRKFMLSFQVKSVALGQSHPNPVDHTSNLGKDYLYMTSDTKMKGAGVGNTAVKMEELQRINKRLYQNDGTDYYVYSCTEVPKYVLCHMLVSADVGHHQEIVEDSRSKIISPPRRPTHIPGSVIHTAGYSSPQRDVGELSYSTPPSSPKRVFFGDFIPLKDSPTAKPNCEYAMHCPNADDRNHLDNYIHPCPRYFETGKCHLVDDISHIKYFSHHLQRGEAGGSVVILNHVRNETIQEDELQISPEIDFMENDPNVVVREERIPEAVIKRPALSPPTRRTPVRSRPDAGMTPAIPLKITKRAPPLLGVDSAPRRDKSMSPGVDQHNMFSKSLIPPKAISQNSNNDWRSMFTELNEVADITPTLQPGNYFSSIPIGNDLGVPHGAGITRLPNENASSDDCDLPPSRLPAANKRNYQDHSHGGRYQDRNLLIKKFERRDGQNQGKRTQANNFRHAGRSPGIPVPSSRPVGSVRRISKHGYASQANTPAGSKKLSMMLSGGSRN